MENKLNWAKEKPYKPCVFVGKNEYKSGVEYRIYQLVWMKSEEYLAWCDDYGYELGDYNDCSCDEYLILEER